MATSPPLATWLLPGMHGSGELFAPFAAALGPSFLPCGIDYNTSGIGCYRALEAALRREMSGASRFAVIAESFSGPTALRLAARPPRGLCAIVLVASFASNPRPALKHLSALLARAPVCAPPAWLIRRSMLGSSASKELVEDVRAAIAQARPALMRARLSAVLKVDERAALQRLAVPVLWLWARQDRLIPCGYPRKLLAAAPTRLEQSGLAGPHLLLQRYPRRSARIIGDWLRKRSSMV